MEQHCLFNKWCYRDFPGCLEVRISPSNAGGAGSIPDREAKIPQASSQDTKHKTEAIL